MRGSLSSNPFPSRLLNPLLFFTQSALSIQRLIQFIVIVSSVGTLYRTYFFGYHSLLQILYGSMFGLFMHYIFAMMTHGVFSPPLSHFVLFFIVISLFSSSQSHTSQNIELFLSYCDPSGCYRCGLYFHPSKKVLLIKLSSFLIL